MYHKDGTVDVKLLADLGYIADRLRNLEQKWDLTELKDLHRRIVLKLDDPPANVLRLRSTLVAQSPTRSVPPPLPLTIPLGSPEQREEPEGDNQLPPGELSPGTSLDEVSSVADECWAPSVVSELTGSDDQEEQPPLGADHGNDDRTEASDANERVRKLDRLENLVIAFYRTCGRGNSGRARAHSRSKSHSPGGQAEVGQHSRVNKPKKKKTRVKKLKPNRSHETSVALDTAEQQQQSQRKSPPDRIRTMNQGADLDQQDLLPKAATTTSDCATLSSYDDPTVVEQAPTHQQQQQQQQISSTPHPSQPLRSIYDECAQLVAEGSAIDREQSLDDEEDTITLTTETSSECCSQHTVVATGQDEGTALLDSPERAKLAGAVGRGCCARAGTGSNTSSASEAEDDDRESISASSDEDSSDQANDEAGDGTTVGTDKTAAGVNGADQPKELSSSRRCSGAEGEPASCDQSKRLRRRISELTNNFCTPKQFQQMYDNLDNITDNDLKLLIKELKRKIEFAERMNWLCLSSRPRGPPHRKTSLPKHSDVKKRFLETCDRTLPDEVKNALRLPAFDSYEWEDWDVIHLMQTMFVELNLVEKFNIPIETLREWLYEVYKHYNDVPFHNYRHCFCVAQMMYAITWHTNLVQRLGELEVLVLLVACICHDLDHPGYNNIYQINARTELALRYNDISPLENHHCSIAFRLLEHPECNIFRNMSKELFKDVREGIIRCILATDMARHNEILTQFQEATPNFDYSNKVHTNLLCMVLIKVSDISNEARPMDVAEPWVDRLLLEFFAQSAAEKSEGLPVTPFMDPDKVSKPGSQVRFIGLVLLPLFEALGELLPELTDLIITPVRVALDYYKRLNDAANKTRRSIAEAEAASSESGGSPQLPRSQSGISVKSRPELHDLPEGSESGDSETATEVDVAEKTAKFKVDTESIHRKQSHPNSRKGSREKRPSMIGEYYTTGTRIRGSHGNIQHTNNRTYFGSNRAISLDQYSNNRRMSDGVPIQTVHSDNSVLYYHHQRQHRSLDHDTMCSSSDKSTSLNSTHEQAAAGRPDDCENMNLHVPPANTVATGKQQRLGKLFGSGTTAAANMKNNNSAEVPALGGMAVPAQSSSASKHFSRMLSFNQQQKLDKLRNNNNNQSKNNNNNSNNNNNNNNLSNSKNKNSSPANSYAMRHVAATAGAGGGAVEKVMLGAAEGRIRQESVGGGCAAGGGGGIDGTISGSVGVADGGEGGADRRESGSLNDRGATPVVVSSSSGSKSFMSRLRQLTGRLSFSFDSRESKKLHLLATGAGNTTAMTTAAMGPPHGGGALKYADQQRSKLPGAKNQLLEGSRTVAICGEGTFMGPANVSSTMIMQQQHQQQHQGTLGPGESFYPGGPVVMSQPKSISPILMQHRHSEGLGFGGAGASVRGRAYSLDVPIGGRNCCRSLSGSTTGGGAGSSCGGSHKSLTFSLNNKSLNEDNDGSSLALVSGDRKSNAAPMRNGTDPSLLLLVDDPSTSSVGGGSKPGGEGI
uniref:Phosphodiesterase n=1 Tax=Anopheles atroparvus TaxID=41427 RepID=A0AAG5CMW6_ANOAO